MADQLPHREMSGSIKLSPLPDGRDLGTFGFEIGRPAHWHILAFVLVSTFLVYASTLSFEFVHDDVVQILGNPAVHSWKYLPQYFTRHVWAFEHPLSQGNYYRPIFLLWCRLNEAAFGDQPGFWHLTTVLTHLLATGLVYILCVRLLRDRLTAGLAALIFGLHPAHIEGVAWIAGVTEPLLAVFLIGSFLCYLKSRGDTARVGKWMALALCLQVLAMLEKETGFVLPFLIFGYEWIYGDTANGRRWVKTILARAKRSLWLSLPYLFVIPPYMAARFYALGAFRYVIDYMPVRVLISTWPSLISFWVKHLIFPFGLASYYDQRRIDHPNLTNFVLPALAALIVGGALYYGASRSRNIAFAASWMILPLVPLLDIRSLPKNDFAHDRYLYLPSVGVAIILAMALRQINAGRWKLLGQPVSQIVASLLVILVLGAGTSLQYLYFKNDWTFYRYNLIFSPRNVYMLNDYAAVLNQYGMQDRALEIFKRAVAEDPEYWDSVFNVGYLEFKRGNLESAEQYLLRAVQIAPGQPDALLDLGLVELKLGKAKQAEAAFKSAIEINPQAAEYHYALGVALEIQGDLPEALQAFNAELEISPHHARAQKQAAEVQARLSKHPLDAGSP
jgi:protein O-mannosyl-transferase